MTWLNIRNVNSTDQSADIYINGQIGENWWDENTVAAADFIRTVNALGELNIINLFINSPGGSVSDGTAIHNFLKRHKATVNVEVLGEASSIASVIAMAGDIINMPGNAIMMIHDPMSPMMGYFNSEELRNLAVRLDVVRDAILASYVDRTGKGADEIQALMKAETYMTGAQAVEMGFADNLLGELKEVACTDKATLAEMFTNLASASADKLKANIPAPPEAPVNLHEIAMNACAKAGFSALATNMVKRCQDESAILAEIATATEIQNICVASNMKEDTEALLAHLGNPVAMVKEAIALCQANSENEVAAILDETSLDDKSKPAVINTSGIYAKRNKKTK
jgi:ATP-dependent protease ClpP protease subunit